MDYVLRFARIASAFGGGVVALLLQKPVLGQFASRPGVDGYVLGIVSAIGLLIASGYLFGVLHGWTFGSSSMKSVAAAASAPVLLISFFIAFVTWFLAAPLVLGAIVFPWCVIAGIKQGSKLPGACRYSK